MTPVHDRRIKMELINILPGEYRASSESCVFSTLLGSCVSVVLYDPVSHVGGMNHFLLPGTVAERRFFLTDNGRYGMNAMELLINSVMKHGGIRGLLVAKIMGGANVLAKMGVNTNVAQRNIDFAREYLRAEDIPIVAQHVGGTVGRKVYLFPTTGRVLLRRVGERKLDRVEREELDYLKRARTETEEPRSDLTLF